MRRPNAPKPSNPQMEQQKPSLSFNSLNFKQNPVTKSSKSLKYPSRSNLLPITCFLIASFFILYAFFSNKCGPVSPRRFGVVIDGGSTGTRIHVFEYKVEGGVPGFDFGPGGHWSMRVNPGLSSFEGHPEGAGGSLVDLLEFGKGKVPREHWGVTDVRLMATAGLRLLDVEIQERIIDSCRKVLGGSGFRFHHDWAMVINGSDEGLYAWVVANYALGSLGGDPHQTTGIIELGGASAQVTFVSSESMPTEFSRTLKFGNVTYNLFSNSLLHFGQNVAFDSMKELLVSSGRKFATGSHRNEVMIDPCTPKGYPQNVDSFSPTPDSLAKKYSSAFHATGNFSECRAAASTLLQRDRDDCPYPHCTLGAAFMPKLHGRFLATENFFYTSQFFGLDSQAHLSHLVAAGQRFCEEDWSNIRMKHSSHAEEDLLHYCFSSAYIVALLHDSLGIPLDDGSIRYTNHVEETPLDWALGAFILQSTGGIDGEHGWFASVVSDDFPNRFFLVGATILLLLAAWYVLKWRKPYLKTIYDLEKGRYIVTRISR